MCVVNTSVKLVSDSVITVLPYPAVYVYQTNKQNYQN